MPLFSLTHSVPWASCFIHESTCGERSLTTQLTLLLHVSQNFPKIKKFSSVFILISNIRWFRWQGRRRRSLLFQTVESLILISLNFVIVTISILDVILLEFFEKYGVHLITPESTLQKIICQIWQLIYDLQCSFELIKKN